MLDELRQFYSSLLFLRFDDEISVIVISPSNKSDLDIQLFYKPTNMSTHHIKKKNANN